MDFKQNDLVWTTIDGSKVTSTNLVKKVIIKPTNHLDHTSITEQYRSDFYHHGLENSFHSPLGVNNQASLTQSFPFSLEEKYSLFQTVYHETVILNFSMIWALYFFSMLRPNTSLLLTSSMLWGCCKNIEEYYNESVGVPVQLLPTVLGLKLAVDLDLGSKYVSAYL